MIHIKNNYYVIVDEFNYTLVSYDGKMRTDKKTNKKFPILRYHGYYGSLENAVNACRQRCIRDALEDGCEDLLEATNIIKTVTDEFIEILKRCGMGDT